MFNTNVETQAFHEVGYRAQGPHAHPQDGTNWAMLNRQSSPWQPLCCMVTPRLIKDTYLFFIYSSHFRCLYKSDLCHLSDTSYLMSDGMIH